MGITTFLQQKMINHAGNSIAYLSGEVKQINPPLTAIDDRCKGGKKRGLEINAIANAAVNARCLASEVSIQIKVQRTFFRDRDT